MAWLGSERVCSGRHPGYGVAIGRRASVGGALEQAFDDQLAAEMAAQRMREAVRRAMQGQGEHESPPLDKAAADGRTATDPSVTRLRAVGAARACEDARLLEAVREVHAAVRLRVLEHKDLYGVTLTRTQERAVAAEVRRLAVAEVEVALGFTVTEAQQAVGVATDDPDLLVLVLGALRRGETSWAMVRAFWRRCAALTTDQRMLVALALFGTDRALAAQERLDPDGELRAGPWARSDFDAALAREATACEGADVAGERERRRRAYARRRAWVRVHDDGTATLGVNGPAISVVALGQRIERAARVLRKAGDARTLDQLRCDLTIALLLYGTIPFRPSTEPCDGTAEVDALVDDALAPDDLERLATILNGQPTVHAQVVVPVDDLRRGQAYCPGCASQLVPDSESPPHPPPPAPSPPSSSPPRPSPPPPSSPPPPPPPSSPPPPPPSSPPPPPTPPSWPPGRDDAPGRGRVAEVLGPHPFFLTPGHARELVLRPGTTLFRLLTDRPDGRLVERSIGAYRPDADMRRQVVAADVYSRAPGPRTGPHAGELDHVVPYGWAGGQTSEINLALLARRPHQFKTAGYWHLGLDARRDLTVRTVLGQVVTGRVHDYRQYTHVRDGDDLEDAVRRIREAEGTEEQRDVANARVRDLLARDPHLRHATPRTRSTFITLTHTGEDGERHPGAGPRRGRPDERTRESGQGQAGAS
ncbi:hypothetical protein [Ornithinimicrobium tianjinense]|nr:hypothetical protein [Ornithinimicrobium tianjinense]